MKRTCRVNHTYKSKASSPAMFAAVAGLLLAFAGALESAELSFVETLRQSAASGELTSIARVQDIALSPEGTHAYVSGDVLVHPLNGFVSDAAISVFSVNTTTGALSILQSVNVVVDQQNQIGTRDVLVSPSGRHVYSTGDTFLTLYERDPVSGLLKVVET